MQNLNKIINKKESERAGEREKNYKIIVGESIFKFERRKE